MSDPQIVVFTDGAAKGNPGPGGWGAIVVTPDQVIELGGGAPGTTNNRMELTGAIQALARVRDEPGPLVIHSDSTYVIKGITEWVPSWRRRGWKTMAGGDVLNRDLWERLAEIAAARGTRAIAWRYVRGHAGVTGNERVDEIASAFALGRNIELYEGPRAGYGRAIMDLSAENERAPRPAGSSPRQSKGAAYSYLSVVGGQAMRHSTWSECERRVKGRSGALYKKAMSAEDEAAILRSWRFDPNNL